MNLPDRVAFTIPGTDIAIYWYAILITLGIVCAVIAASILSKKRKMPADTAIDLCLWAVPLGLIFARVYYVLFNLSEYHTFLDALNIRNGGLAIPGGIIGGVLGVVIYWLIKNAKAKKNPEIKRKRIWGYFDIMVPGVALAQAIGRWGNFFNQEAYGIGVTKFLYFPFVVRIENCGCELAEAGIRHGHLATFFYESMFCLIIFITLLIVTNKQKRTGDVLFTYLGMYSFERMILEQFRTDALMVNVFGLNIRVTQILCAAVFCGVLAYAIVRAFYEKKHEKLLLPIIADEYYEPTNDKKPDDEEKEQIEIDIDINPATAQTVEAEEDDSVPDDD